jgi:hypothetical protein
MESLSPTMISDKQPMIAAYLPVAGQRHEIGHTAKCSRAGKGARNQRSQRAAADYRNGSDACAVNDGD